MKMIARTTGPFMLHQPRIGVMVPEEGLGVVTACGWVDRQINQGQLQIMSSPLSDEVTFESMVDILNQFEGNEASTIEYFQESHPFDGTYERTYEVTELDSVVKQVARRRKRKNE